MSLRRMLPHEQSMWVGVASKQSQGFGVLWQILDTRVDQLANLGWTWGLGLSACLHMECSSMLSQFSMAWMWSQQVALYLDAKQLLRTAAEAFKMHSRPLGRQLLPLTSVFKSPDVITAKNKRTNAFHHILFCGVSPQQMRTWFCYAHSVILPDSRYRGTFTFWHHQSRIYTIGWPTKRQILSSAGKPTWPIISTALLHSQHGPATWWSSWVYFLGIYYSSSKLP